MAVRGLQPPCATGSAPAGDDAGNPRKAREASPLLVRVLSSTIAGIDALPVEVETDISKGLPSLTIVGLPGGAVRESADRVRAAIRNSGFPFPGRRITINLAPADRKKDGALLDLPIALSLLCAEGLVPANALGKTLVGGELSLDGSVRPVRGGEGMMAVGRDGRLYLNQSPLTGLETVHQPPLGRDLISRVSLAPLVAISALSDGADQKG